MIDEDILEEIMSSKTMEIIERDVATMMFSLYDKIDAETSQILLGVWISINLELMLANKSDPEQDIQAIMNQITISQNKYINNYRNDLN
jgi:hypothetical protein